jgi:hypothetical protein
MIFSGCVKNWYCNLTHKRFECSEGSRVHKFAVLEHPETLEP